MGAGYSSFDLQLSMEVSENTENDRQIDHRLMACCVIPLSIGTRKL